MAAIRTHLVAATVLTAFAFVGSDSGRSSAATTTPPPVATPAITSTAPAQSPSPEPTDTASAVATPTTLPTTASPTDTPTPSTSSATPTPSPSPTTRVASPTSTPLKLPATSPAVQDSGITLTTGLLAIIALVLAGAALWVVHRADTRRPGTGVSPAPSGPIAADSAATAALLVVLGEAMIDSGYTVSQVQATLRRVLQVNGIPGGEVIVLPTALFVSVPGEATVETAVAAAGLSRLRLDQVDAVSRVVVAAETGVATPVEARAALLRARGQPPPFGPVARVFGYALLSTGLALILGAGAVDMLVAGFLGGAVGALQLVAGRAGTVSQAILPTLCAFLVAASVFVLVRLDQDIGVLAPLVAPLVTFLPGALLTTAVIELSTGQMVSGAGRLATGLLQLALLALGIVAGAELVGVPAATLVPVAGQPLGDLAPWVGVVLFGTGVLIYHCARLASFGWIILVLYVAYGAQIIGGLFLGAVLSAFFGALVMSPVASYVALRRTGPPIQVTFLPAFWLLVPGALGLVGVTQLLDDNRVDAVTSLVTMGTTMIGISFGVLIGLAVGTTTARRFARPAPVSVESGVVTPVDDR